MRIGLVLLLTVAGVLYLYNPNLQDFQEYVRTQASTHLQRELGNTALGQAFTRAGSDLAALLTRKATRRDNYYFWSIYTIDPDGDDGEQDYWRFLGIGGQFFLIERPRR
ncbi:DUF4359 domain-containing protein [Rhodothermus profundi]|uniref:DUF4359 domain-containing protein n=1 Tax=Rhodothermus profundi TaxID=633813 RepID=A0A1M6TZR1_9BACT|nr:DUF4359 domain-containing protein [Rhodothermus profundi]SHK62401.1 protein of unknown function [Rhodothermus profundi]